MDRIDLIGPGGLKVRQRPGEATFSVDALLLAHFVRPHPGDHLCDLGTGTGIIPLLMAAGSPVGAVVGIEIREETAALAEQNVELNGLHDRVAIFRGDLRRVTLGDLGRSRPFDLITANPPFRRPGTGRISPHPGRAIARHELECTLDEVLAAARRLVRFSGRVGLIFLGERLTDLILSLRTHGLEPKRLRMVRPRPGRPAKLVLVEAIAGGRSGLVVEPDLIMRDPDGDETPEMKSIYGERPRTPDYTVYMVRCADGTYYTGMTKDLKRRLADHNRGRGARYTRGRGPVRVVATRGRLTFGEAARLERNWKSLTRSQKEELVRKGQSELGTSTSSPTSNRCPRKRGLGERKEPTSR